MQNDGGIKRGDREDTGDLKARPRPDAGPGGSGVHGTANVRGGGDGPSGVVTGDASAMGGSSLAGIGGIAGTETQLTEDMADLNVVDANDPSLGLTNVGEVGPDDWAADTGPTRTNEGGTGIATADLSDDGSTLGPDRSHHRNVAAREDVKDRPERTSKR